MWATEFADDGVFQLFDCLEIVGIDVFIEKVQKEEVQRTDSGERGTHSSAGWYGRWQKRLFSHARQLLNTIQQTSSDLLPWGMILTGCVSAAHCLDFTEMTLRRATMSGHQPGKRRSSVFRSHPTSGLLTYTFGLPRETYLLRYSQDYLRVVKYESQWTRLSFFTNIRKRYCRSRRASVCPMWPGVRELKRGRLL